MEKSLQSEFPMRLRVLRRARHLTQDEVAEQLHVHRTTYTKYESGAAAPEQHRLLQLAEFFHVSVDFLLGNSDMPVRHALETSLHDGTFQALDLREQQLLAAFRRLSPAEQEKLLRELQSKKR